MENFTKLFSKPSGTNINISMRDLKEIGISKIEGKARFGFRDILSELRILAKHKHRRQNPIAPGQADLVQWTLYDRQTNAQATTVPTKFTFFNVPIGTNNKTKADTNIEQVMRLPDPEWMNVVGLGFYFASNMIKADIDGFLNTYFMEFWVSSKVYLEGPFQCYPAAAGIMGATTQNSLGVFTNGVPRTDNFFDVRLPAGLQLGLDDAGQGIMTDGLIGITILQGQSFKVDCQAPAGGLALTSTATNAQATGLNLMCYAYGIKSRGVQ